MSSALMVDLLTDRSYYPCQRGSTPHLGYQICSANSSNPCIIRTTASDHGLKKESINDAPNLC